MMKQQLYTGGNIITMEEPLFVEAVLVENGQILCAGNLADVLRNADDAYERIDLKGHTMIPAFIDTHSHFWGYLHALLQVPLEEAGSYADIAHKIKAFIQNHAVPDGEWIIAKGYDHNRLREKHHPTRALLDAAAPNHPVMLQHQSGHMGVFNSLALDVLQVDAKTKPPAGGKIEIENGVPSGYMEETAFLQYQKKVPARNKEDLMEAFLKAQKAYASYGITTVQDGMMIDLMADAYQTLYNGGLLELDLVGYVDMDDSEKLRNIFRRHMGRYHNHFKIGGYKIFLDGSPQGRTAWMLTSYLPAQEAYCGYAVLTDAQVYRHIAQALKENMQLLAHCNGDAACLQYITAYEKARQLCGVQEEIRPVIIHAQLISENQLIRAAASKMIPSFFVAHVYHWGDVHIENFGFARAEQISPAASARRLGMPFTFHQDAPVIEPNMLETIWCAVNRITKRGVVLGEEQCISALDALRAVTVHAAYQYFEETSKGSIKPGKQANFVILDSNPLEIDPMRLREIKVIQTICRGKTIYTTSNECK